jgi:hypothetical protein
VVSFAYLGGLAALAAAAVLLWRRVNRACVQARQTLAEGGPATPFLDALARCVEQSLDESMAAPGGASGLQGIEVPHREHQDPYRTVAELLADVARKARAPAVPFDPLIKATYQLSSALAIPPDRIEPCLNILIEGLQSASARPIGRVQRIVPGELVDTKTMVPLNYGPRVAYPLGVTTFDAEGKVLSRARVICS